MIAAVAFLLAAADPHAGHAMPAVPPPAAADPHAGHDMAPKPATPAADPHAGHVTPAALETPGPAADLPVGDALPPPAPADHLADAVFGAAAMSPARDLLSKEHGRVRVAMTMFDRLELRPAGGGDGYAWQGGFRYGGDINRIALKTEGEGRRGGDLEHAEVQALYSRAIGPYFDLQAGVRQDVRPRPQRTYASLGVQGLAPYWFEVGATAFLSEKGDLSARFEVEYDLRLGQRLILQPAAEIVAAASSDPAAGVGAGLSRGEAGLRLRYEFKREFAPYIGVHYERRFGKTGDLARAAGEDVEGARVVVGLRTWF